VAAVLILMFALAFTMYQLSSEGAGGRMIRSWYYYDLGSGSLFVGDVSSYAPIGAPSGTIEYKGEEQQAGMKAYVIACGACESSLDGMSLQEIRQTGAEIAYLEKFSVEAKQHLEAMEGKGMTMPMMMEDPAMMGRLVAEAPEEPGMYPEFYNLATPSAQMLHQAFLEECPDGSRPTQCVPGN